MRCLKKVFAIVLTVLLLPTAALASNDGVEVAMTGAAEHLISTVSPVRAQTGGEWTVISLARSGVSVPEGYFETYLKSLTEKLKESDGVLHARRYTEYSRAIIALTALGENPADFAGYDLISMLADMDKVSLQGINGCIFALIALDSGGYEIPADNEAGRQTTREGLISAILANQQAGGGFGLAETGDVDVTATALQALAKYRDDPRVEAAVEAAIGYLSSAQRSDGGFFGMTGGDNLESCAQVIIALCGLGILPDDPRFVKSGGDLYTVLLGYRHEGGGFKHLKTDETADVMSSEQALCALVSLHRLKSGLTPLYDMGSRDAEPITQYATEDRLAWWLAA